MIEIENADNRDFMIHHHLGTGDHFICNGLVNYICSEIEKETEKFLLSSPLASPLVYLACKKRNIETVSYLYSENKMIRPAELNFYSLAHGEEIDYINDLVERDNLKLIRIGFDHCDHGNFEESFYKQLNIPYEVRYTYFNLPKTKFPKMLEIPKEKYILIHDSCSDASYDLNIGDSLTKIYFDESEPLFAYVDLIKGATEIHCINSSIYHLIDNMADISDQQLFFHNVRQTSVSCKISKKWIVV